jgi:hypothetical protein
VHQTRPCGSRLKRLGMLRCLRHGHLVGVMELRLFVLCLLVSVLPLVVMCVQCL